MTDRSRRRTKTFIIGTVVSLPLITLATVPSSATVDVLNQRTFSMQQPTDSIVETMSAIGTTTLSYDLTITGEHGVSNIAIPLAEGALPTGFSGKINSTYDTPGVIEITVSGRIVASVDAMTGGMVSFPLTAEDMNKGFVTLTMLAKISSPTGKCFANTLSTATLKKGTLSYTYPTFGPTTIGKFLSEGVSSYTVTIPKNPTVYETQAGLDAVAALTYRYASPTKIVLLATDETPAHNYMNRILRIKQNDENNNIMTVDKNGMMLVRGGPSTLSPATIALADPNTDLLQNSTATSVSASPQFEKTSQLSLDKLGNAPVSLIGIGQLQTVLSVNQPMFGQQVNEISINLKGANTPLSLGADGRIDLLWNGVLTKSISMLNKTIIDETLVFRSEDIQRDNGLTIMMSYTPASGKCSQSSLPARLDLNMKKSKVTIKNGNGVPAGFQRFPQAFEGNIPVVFNNVTDFNPQSIKNAGNLVASIQSAGNQQLVTEILDEKTFESRNRGGLLVDADNALTKELKAPITSDGNTAIGPDGKDFQADTGSFGSLQAFNNGKHDIIILSGIASNSYEQTIADTRAAILATYVNTPPHRWSTFSGQGLLLGNSRTPMVVDIPVLTPQATKASTFIVVGIIGIFFIIIILLVWLWKRPKGSPPPLPGVGVVDE